MNRRKDETEEEFKERRRESDRERGRDPACAAANRERVRKWRQTPHGQARVKENNHAWYKRHRYQEDPAYAAAHKARYKRRTRDVAIELATLAGVPAVCALCGTEADLVLDHDHASGVSRGLLCGPCNTTLGLRERRGRGDRGDGWAERADAYLADPPVRRALVAAFARLEGRAPATDRDVFEGTNEGTL